MASALDHRTVVNLAVVMALPRIRGDLHPIRRGAMMMMICTFELLRESERERERGKGWGGERERVHGEECVPCACIDVSYTHTSTVHRC